MAWGDFAGVNAIELPDTNYLVLQDIAKKYDYMTTEIHRLTPVVMKGVRNRVYYFEDVVFRDKRQLKYDELPVYTKELIESMELAGQSALLIDGTGIGEAVYDLYTAIGLDPLKIIFTGGNSASVEKNKTEAAGMFGLVSGIKVPKVDLIQALQVYVQQGRLRQTKGLPFADDSREQFQNFVGKINEDTKHVKYENEDEEVHDDLVVTAAMGCWYTQHTRSFLYGGKSGGIAPADRKSSYNTNPFKEDEKIWRF